MRYKVANDYMYIGSSTLKKMKWDEDCLPGRIKHRECRNNLEHSAGEGEDWKETHNSVVKSCKLDR